MHLYIKLTLAITAALVAIVLFGLVIKLLVVGAIIAALVLGGLFLYNFARAMLRRSAPVGTPTAQ